MTNNVIDFKKGKKPDKATHPFTVADNPDIDINAILQRQNDLLLDKLDEIKQLTSELYAMRGEDMIVADVCNAITAMID